MSGRGLSRVTQQVFVTRSAHLCGAQCEVCTVSLCLSPKESWCSLEVFRR